MDPSCAEGSESKGKTESEKIVPFESVKQKMWMKRNKPDLYRKWMKKYGGKIKGKTALSKG